MDDPRAVEAAIAKRFRLSQAPSFIARVGALKLPVSFTHLKSAEVRRIETMNVPFEQSFSLQVPLRAPYVFKLWLSGREKIVPAATPGNAYLFDLSENPTVRQNTAFSTIRFNISRAVIAEYAHEHALRNPSGLFASSFESPDPVMSTLAQTIAAALERSREITSLFVDYVALAFCAHALHNYAGAAGSISIRGGLASWQLRRACEFVEANLSGDPSIADVAAECGLSSSYFAKAFRQAMGMPPHVWLLTRRIDRAKQLLIEEKLELSQIAVACGFVDQSHLSRTFVKIEGCSPGKWRRSRLN